MAYGTFLSIDYAISFIYILKPLTKCDQFALYWAHKMREFKTPEVWRHISIKYNPTDCEAQSACTYQLKDVVRIDGLRLFGSTHHLFYAQYNLFQTFLLIL